MTFTIRLASGRVVGPVSVHGAGGPITSRSVLGLAIDRATEGRPMGRIYEPTPGHVRVYEQRAAGNENEEHVDIRGAVVV